MTRVMLAMVAGLALAAGPRAESGDDFERGLDAHWTVSRPPRIHVGESGDAAHGRVMVLDPDGDDVYALLKGTGGWQGGVIEGDVMFPSSVDAYLGIVFDFRRHEGRTDFGVIYIKGNESYAQANPHFDFNVSRTVYPEYRVPLTGPAAIAVGQWQHFKLETVSGAAHLYVGDMTTPQMTFPFFPGTWGALGLQPRSVGEAVWVDNVRWRPISALSYAGPPKPALAYAPGTFLTSWTVAGPFRSVDDDFARRPDRHGEWRAFATDARGAVITSSVTAFHGDRTVAYFRTRVVSTAREERTLTLSTADDMAVWVDGRFAWFVPRQAAAWFDVLTNPQHAGQRIPIALRAGVQDIVIRVRGGSYATGGFFAALEQRPADPEPVERDEPDEPVERELTIIVRLFEARAVGQ